MKNVIKEKWKKIYTLICICLAVMLVPVQAFAAPENKDTQLAIDYPLAGVEFAFYKVADFSDAGIFNLEYPFDIYADEIAELEMIAEEPEKITTETWIDLAKTLESYVVSEKLDYDFQEKTSDSGNITIESIDMGLYLILGESAESEGKRYSPAPVLMTVPNRDEKAEWDYQVVLDYSGKTSVDNLYEEYTVIKIWDDYGNEKKRPSEIQVDLFMEGMKEPYDTVVLNEKNNWEYTWKELPIGNKWTVAEKKVPDNYKVKYQAEGNDLIIVNTYSEPPVQGGKIPQTGQLWWPVPFLAIGGLAFIIVGLIRRNSEDY